MKNWIVPEFQRSIVKHPSEEVRISCDFSDKVLPYFGKLTSATFSAEKWPLSDPAQKTDGSEIFQEGTIQIQAPYQTHARVIVAGGVAEHDYQVTCIAETEDGQTFEQDFFVRVKEL
jgi:hypothetical protein